MIQKKMFYQKKKKKKKQKKNQKNVLSKEEEEKESAKSSSSSKSTTSNGSSSSSVQSALESKKGNDEKRKINKRVDALKKENIELKKKLQKFDKLNNELMNEIEENKASSEYFIKEKNDMEVICKKAQQELKLITQRNEELSKPVQELKDGVEIYKEEAETKELEMELIQKQFDEFKIKSETEIKKAKLNVGRKNAGNVEENKTEEIVGSSSGAGGDGPLTNSKISKLEDIIKDLSNQLNSTSEQRNYAISYYKGEIEK